MNKEGIWIDMDEDDVRNTSYCKVFPLDVHMSECYYTTEFGLDVHRKI